MYEWESVAAMHTCRHVHVLGMHRPLRGHEADFESDALICDLAAQTLQARNIARTVRHHYAIYPGAWSSSIPSDVDVSAFFNEQHGYMAGDEVWHHLLAAPTCSYCRTPKHDGDLCMHAHVHEDGTTWACASMQCGQRHGLKSSSGEHKVHVVTPPPRPAGNKVYTHDVTVTGMRMCWSWPLRKV